MEHLKGKAILKEQRGSMGYYAGITLSAQLRDTEGPPRGESPTIEFSEAFYPEWRDAARVGVRIGWSYLPAKYTHGKQANITIESINWMPCDTTDIVVLHVAAKAVLSMFDANPDKCPVFVPEFGLFLF